MAIKGPQLAMLVWLANLVILGGGGYFGYSIWTDMSESRERAWEEASRPVVRQERIDWAELFATRSSNVSAFAQARLSPTPRRVERQPDRTPPPPPPPPPEPTHEELKAEVQAWADQTFQLRWVYGPTAVVELKDTSPPFRFRVAAGMTMRTVQLNNLGMSNDKIKKMAEQGVTFVRVVLNIEGPPSEDHVVLRAPSRNENFKDREFEVKIKLGPGADRTVTQDSLRRNTRGAGTTASTGAGRAATPRETVQREPDGDAPPQPQRTESTFDESSNTWTLGQQDYMEVDINEMARHARVVYDQTTNRPIGIQITDSLPSGSLLRQRGAQPNDIIKSINGTPVTSSHEAIRIVRTQYNEGVRRFEVVFERAGVEQRMTYNAGN
jgi:hypothetical protein